jgi:hypothetical protein
MQYSPCVRNKATEGAMNHVLYLFISRLVTQVYSFACCGVSPATKTSVAKKSLAFLPKQANK